MIEMPVIDRAKCTDCGLCVDVCLCGALVRTDHGIDIIAVDKCGWCTMCELVCPFGAITCPFEIVIEEE